MKFIRSLHIVIILAMVAACAPGVETGSPTGAPTSSLPTAVVNVTALPNITQTFETFVTAWRADEYAAMYAMLSAASRQAINEDDFVARYKAAMNTMSLRQLDYNILATNTTPQTAEVTFKVVYRTYIAGDLEREMTARWVNENGQWKLDWSETLILPELGNGRKLVMDYQIPPRGNIFDKNGSPIVAQDDVYAVGLQPGNIIPEQEETLLREMARLAGTTPEDIAASYRFAQPNWYIPVAEASAGEIANRLGLISGLGGVLLTQYRSRYYYAGGLAPHVIGYVISVPAEEFDLYKRRGYSGAEKVGYSGIEKWGEDILGGQRGGRLYILNPDGTIGAALGQSGQTSGSSIHLTLESDFQRQVQDALKGLTGAVVVMERDTGRVLAMAASPTFDPNLFEGQNPNRQILGNVLSNPANPLFNRATQSTYPLGSVFKIITMAAGLESGDFTAESTYDCQYEFTELGSPILYDWTWERYQRELANTGEGKTKPSGLLTLPEGLMRSCNPWFYHIGLTLFRNGKGTAIADMALGFGLGQPTGIGQVAEAPGVIRAPESPLEATNEAIGQDPVLVTPLQVATFTAALGNGGTLYRPQLVEKIVDASGNETNVFKPESRGVLPISPENLKIIQDAMRSVVGDQRGTAYNRFVGITTPVFGKTGTAQNGTNTPHAWFSGYTNAGREDRPDIAIAVIIEFQGEGSEWAAPVFRRVLEIYFTGRPQRLYPWESNFGVTRTPTPQGFNLTQTAEAEATPTP